MFDIPRTRLSVEQKLLKDKAVEKMKELGPPPVVEPSKMSMTLLQNFILSICLMKNIAMKFLCLKNPTPLNQAVYKEQIKT